jgi:hypothetical protein
MKTCSIPGLFFSCPVNKAFCCMRATVQPLLVPFACRHYLACHPAGAVVNFHMNAGGATAWMHVAAGHLVGHEFVHSHCVCV